MMLFGRSMHGSWKKKSGEPLRPTANALEVGVFCEDFDKNSKLSVLSDNSLVRCMLKKYAKGFNKHSTFDGVLFCYGKADKAKDNPLQGMYEDFM